MWSSDEEALATVRSLAAGGDLAGLSQHLNRPPVVREQELDSTGDILDHVTAIGELTYDGRPIVTGATTPPWTSPSMDRIALPFAGGELEPGRFATRSSVLPDSRPLAFVVIANPAQVGPAEARILRALARDQVGLGIEPANTVVVGAAAGAVATAVVGHYTDKATDRIDREVVQWARNREREQQREQREVQQRWNNHQAAERNRYRNAGLVPGADRFTRPTVGLPRTLEDLLAARREMLGLAARAKFPNIE